MICHMCHQHSIKIVMDNDSDISTIHIRCEICGLDIDCNSINPLLCDLFLYNENLEEAEKLGMEALIEDKDIKDNPYSFSSDQIILNKRWEYGYNREKESYEFSALSLSSEKIEAQLREESLLVKTELQKETIEKEKLKKKIDRFIHMCNLRIEDFCSKLLGIKILGRIMSKHILYFQQDYGQLHKEFWKDLKFPVR